MRLGTGRTYGVEFRTASEAFRSAEDCALDNLSSTGCRATERPIEVDLAALSLKDLGFNDDPSGFLKPSWEQIHTVARGFGLQLCPCDVGPELFLQYKVEPKDAQWHPENAWLELNVPWSRFATARVGSAYSQ